MSSNARGGWDTGGTVVGHDDWFDFSCSACRAGGKMVFIAKVMLLKGWLVRAGVWWARYLTGFGTKGPRAIEGDWVGL